MPTKPTKTTQTEAKPVVVLSPEAAVTLQRMESILAAKAGTAERAAALQEFVDTSQDE